MHGFFLSVCISYIAATITLYYYQWNAVEMFFFLCIHVFLSSCFPCICSIFFFLFLFFVQIAETTNLYIDVCVCVYAMHLRSGHIHMQLIHYASSIATEWLLWRFFVCCFFFLQKQNRRLSFRFVCLLRIFSM